MISVPPTPPRIYPTTQLHTLASFLSLSIIQQSNNKTKPARLFLIQETHTPQTPKTQNWKP